MTELHKHDWKQVATWPGRYRCAVCKAFGHRGIVQGKNTWGGNDPLTIIPYRCSVTLCRNPAVTKLYLTSKGKHSSNKRWYCAGCRPDRDGKNRKGIS